MRCAQCGVTIKGDPVYNAGSAFCSLDCAEESRLVRDEELVHADDYPDPGIYESELHHLFSDDNLD